VICSLQNARLTAGTVRSRETAHAASDMGAMKATRTKPTTEPARVSSHN